MQICAISREKKSYLGKANTMSTERKHKPTSLGKKALKLPHITSWDSLFHELKKPVKS